MDLGITQGVRSWLDDFDSSPTPRQQLVTLVIAGITMGVISATLLYLDLI
jgi:hypothetical protein